MSRIKLRYGFKTEAEDKSLELRKANKLDEHERLPAAQLAACLNVTLLFPKDIAGIPLTTLNTLNRDSSKWSAIAFQVKEKGIVILNPRHSEARIESNIFHELAHIICKHDMKGFKQLNGISFRVYDKEQEDEAEWMGGCLHIPRKGLEWAFRNNMDRDSICKFYCASKDMVTFRINGTGIKNQYRFSKSN